MGTLSTSARQLGRKPLPQLGGQAVELPEQLALAEFCREELVLFVRRRMLDWKLQVTRTGVVLGGSALVFALWKSLVSWLG